MGTGGRAARENEEICKGAGAQRGATPLSVGERGQRRADPLASHVSAAYTAPDVCDRTGEGNESDARASFP